MKIRSAWIGFAGVVLAAVIAVIFTRPETKPNSVFQKADSGNNNNAGRNNISAGHDVAVNNTYNYVEPSKTKSKVKSAAGDTYNVTSNNQKGGITAAKVIVFNHAQIILSENGANNAEIESNYVCTLDPSLHRIFLHPKQGSWDTVFIGLPKTEKDQVDPHFGSKSGTITGARPGTYNVKSDSLFGMTTAGTPADGRFYYFLHYDSLPSYIIFGNNSGPLYKIDLYSKQNP